MHPSITLLAGVVLDAAYCDPPNAVHPVAWFGQAAGLVERRAPRSRAAGAAASAGLVAAAAVAAAGLQRAGGPIAAGAIAVWLTTSRRMLLARATEVADALDKGDLNEARRLLARHLVSRDTSALTASEVAGATIESVAENLSDAVAAPWCWYRLGGAPAAAAYRALNTLDGMWGYRTQRYEAFGWAAARADDLANLLPARLTAAALILAAGGRAPQALEAWRRDRGRTDSPNAGHPMAAAAGALGVVLRKRGEYVLGEGGREPSAADVRRAVALADRASMLLLGAVLATVRCSGVRR